MQFQRHLLGCAIAATVSAWAAPVFADSDARTLDSVSIVGDRASAFSVSGSAHVLDNQDLEEKSYTDIHRILRDVPGVYIQEEEGFGLRPNIGIRGTGTGRSERVSVMEDSVLIAPAPYAAPAAYYFPSAGRFHGVEVLKGPDTLRYGPFTVGGAINFLSTPIPETASGMINVEAGERGEQRAHVHYGASKGQFGFLLETHQHRAEGFKDIDRSNRDSGFDKRDYVAKLRWTASEDAAVQQALELKLEHETEVSNETYLGLTDQDFKRDPNRRYGLSEIDQMNTERDAASLRHTLVFNDDTQLKTTLYRNEFKRNWFKLDRVDGSSIGALVASANAGDAASQAVLNGNLDADDLQYKNNNREYISEGVQTELNYQFGGDWVQHDLVMGTRFHRDEVDRFQPVDVYDQRNGSLVFQQRVQPSGGNNRLEKADAVSAWIVDHAYIGDVIVTGSLRYENVDSSSKRWSDVERNDQTASSANRNEEVLGGLGATWLLNDQWSLLAGVHQGFAPAGASATRGTDPEKSLNYEAGFRYWNERYSADLVAFHSDYENTLQSCSVARPCDGQTSGTFSLGESRVSGLELGLNSILWQTDGGLQFPARLAYTYTDGEITSTADDDSVIKGDILPYLPEHLASVSVGIERPAVWSATLSLNYTDEMCVDNSCDRSGEDDTFKRTSDYLVTDLVGSYYINSGVEVYAKLDNVFDEQEIVARDPAGARPNKPRTAYLGMRVKF